MCIVMCCTFISAFGTNSRSDVVLENLTVVPDSSTSVELEWKVVPTDGHHCIRQYNIQITSPNGSQWEVQIPGSNHSFRFTGIQLIPFQEYTYCVTANLLRGQIDLKLTVNFTQPQGGLKYDKVITMLNQSKFSTHTVLQIKVHYCNLPKICPPWKSAHPPFWMKLLQRMHAFLSKVHSPIYAAVHAVTLSKKHQRSSTVQEEGLTNEGQDHLLYCMSKWMTKEALQNHCMCN